MATLRLRSTWQEPLRAEDLRLRPVLGVVVNSVDVKGNGGALRQVIAANLLRVGSMQTRIRNLA